VALKTVGCLLDQHADDVVLVPEDGDQKVSMDR
jgi:hypothetical protein